MPNVKYTDSATFRCLENLKEGSLDISLIHTGKEHCPPGHICSMPRDEFIIHFVLEEGSETQSKEALISMAARSQKFIQGLEAALVRINNKTYGICRETGKLIPKERLRAVPHATLSIEAKNARDKKRR